MDKKDIKKLLRESLINEVGGSDVLKYVETKVEDLFDDVLNHFGEDRLSKTMVTDFLIKSVESVGRSKGFDKGNDPSYYRS